jgi:hypothetical protein
VTPDWYEDLAERLGDALDDANDAGCTAAVARFRRAQAAAADRAEHLRRDEPAPRAFARLP